MAEIAIVDDEEILADSLRIEMSEMGHLVRVFYRATPFLEYIRSKEPDLIFLDLRLPDINGLEVLNKIMASPRFIPTIIITAHGDMDSAIQALKGGAYDYINKPFDLDEIGILIHRALNETKLVCEVQHHRLRAASNIHLTDFIGNSPPVKDLLQTVKKLSRVGDTTVLLRGESGTGKDLLAKAIHNLSARAERQFIDVNCATIPEHLLESELFGYEKGAFTDARSRKIGLVELADGGTLFLDEIGDLPKSLQVKLLRFMESRSFRRIGGTLEVRVDVLILAATNRNLETDMENGLFRPDLYYRLNVVPITIPPLRVRSTDIITLAEHYLAHFSKKFRKPMIQLGDDVRESFLCYHWPGNVRELKNLVERLVILCADACITFKDLPMSVKDAFHRKGRGMGRQQPVNTTLDERLADYERELISEALETADGVKSEAADHLGISRYALLRKMKRLFNG